MIAASDPRLSHWLTGAVYLIAHDCHSLNHPFALKIVNDKMLRTPIIPHGNRSRRPLIPNRESGIFDPLGEIFQQDLAFPGALNEAAQTRRVYLSRSLFAAAVKCVLVPHVYSRG